MVDGGRDLEPDEGHQSGTVLGRSVRRLRDVRDWLPSRSLRQPATGVLERRQRRGGLVPVYRPLDRPDVRDQHDGVGTGTLKVYGNGVFTYDTPNDHKSNSWDNPGQYALFRLVGAETTRYFLGIEDVPLCFADNDHDYNDYVVTFTTLNDPIVPPAPVPEPSTLVLLGSAMAVLGVRRKVFAWSRCGRG